MAFDAPPTPLRYDMTGAERSAEAMASLRQHMLMFLPIVSAVADRIGFHRLVWHRPFFDRALHVVLLGAVLSLAVPLTP